MTFPRGNKHSVAVKTECACGKRHDSRKEARRCADLRMLQIAGSIVGLKQQPFYAFGTAMMENGQQAGVTLDFSYVENGKLIAEDVKGKSKKSDNDKWPIKKAMFRYFYPDTELREFR